MPSYNRCTLMGNLGKDPETKTFANGGSVCNFSIATTEAWNDKASGERKERTDWHNIVCNGKTGEIAQKYLAKGSPVLIEGSIRNRSYEKDGQTRYVTEIQCDRLVLLGKAPEAPRASVNEHKRARAAEAGGGFRDDDVDGIPF